MSKWHTYEEIEKLVDEESYLTNIDKINKILEDASKDFSVGESEQLENFYYAIIISKKYNKKYTEVVGLIDKYTKVYDHFEVRYRQFYFLKTTEERIRLLIGLKSYDIYFASRILRKIIIDSNVKDIVKYKKMYCEISIMIAQSEEYNNYQKLEFIQLALKISKELNEKSLYEKLIKIDKDLKLHIFQSMSPMEIELPSEVNTVLAFTVKKIRENFSKVLSAEDLIKLFINRFYINAGDKGYIYCLSESIVNVKEFESRHKSLADLVSWSTFDGMKLVKSKKIDGMANDFARKIIIKTVINPIIEEGVKKLGKDEIINYLTSSYFVFEEDKMDIEIALNFYFDGDYRSFIYYIVPNIEKIIRNILDINEIPSYHNSSSDPQYQTTFVLTDSLNKLEEENILDKELIRLLNEKLNDSEYENYRHKLSHKLDNNIFCYDCASDLLRILIVILFCYEKNSEIINILGDQKEVEEVLRMLEEKKEKAERQSNNVSE